MARSTASSTRLVVMLVAVRQPRMRQAQASTTNATYAHPDHVDTLNRRCTRSAAREGVRVRDGGALGLHGHATPETEQSVAEASARPITPWHLARSNTGHTPLTEEAGGT